MNPRDYPTPGIGHKEPSQEELIKLAKKYRELVRDAQTLNRLHRKYEMDELATSREYLNRQAAGVINKIMEESDITPQQLEVIRVLLSR